MRVLRLVLAILVVLVVSFLGLAASFGTGRGLDAIRQLRRVAMLRSNPALPAAVFPDPSIPGDTPLDRIQVMATHNSYHRRSGPLQHFLIGLAQPGEPRKLRYEHDYLYEQLDAGIRGLELDVRNRGRRLVVSHVPLVDNRTNGPDLRLALEEIRLWSLRNPAHVPVYVLLELKEDWMALDPRTRAWDSTALDRLDGLIRDVFPVEGRITPSAAAGNAGWPPLDALRGRVMFILHVDPRITDLYRGDTMWESRSGGADARIQILNDPAADRVAMAESLTRGDLVRTRADADLVEDPARLRAALSSGAQIISTDYPKTTRLVDGGMIRVLTEP